MTLRNTTVDNSIKISHKVNKLNVFQEKEREREIVNPTQYGIFHFLVNKAKNFSQNNERKYCKKISRRF